jgi:hypothetical protein
MPPSLGVEMSEATQYERLCLTILETLASSRASVFSKVVPSALIPGKFCRM